MTLTKVELSFWNVPICHCYLDIAGSNSPTFFWKCEAKKLIKAFNEKIFISIVLN